MTTTLYVCKSMYDPKNDMAIVSLKSDSWSDAVIGCVKNLCNLERQPYLKWVIRDPSIAHIHNGLASCLTGTESSISNVILDEARTYLFQKVGLEYGLCVRNGELARIQWDNMNEQEQNAQMCALIEEPQGSTGWSVQVPPKEVEEVDGLFTSVEAVAVS